MDTVKSIVSSVSVTMIFFGIIVLLLPEGTMKKPILNFASVALIATVISCFTNVSFSADSIDKPTFNSSLIESEFKNKTENLTLEVAKDSLEKLIESNFLANGINNFDIYLKVDNYENNSIFISELIIYCSQKDSAKCEEIIKNLGLDANIIKRE